MRLEKLRATAPPMGPGKGFYQNQISFGTREKAASFPRIFCLFFFCSFEGFGGKANPLPRPGLHRGPVETLSDKIMTSSSSPILDLE